MFEKDVVEKCEKEPKLFYRYINGKMTSKEAIDKLAKGGRVYQTAEKMSEPMIESFRCVQCKNGLYRVSVQRQEIGKLLQKLDARKAMGPDGVSN